MKQPYSCWLEVLEGVRWDRKRSLEPNLHVCGEDDIKRAVYNMKECIEGKGSELLNKEYLEEKLMKERTELVLKGN